MTPQQETLLQSTLGTIRSKAHVLGVLLQGSLARGDGFPGSDMDLFVLLKDGHNCPFSSVISDGLMLEQHFGDFDLMVSKLHSNPMLVYGFLEGRLLYDPTGRLAELVAVACQVRDAYQTPPETQRGILYWLQSARIKITAAQYGGDTRKAALVVGTTSWKILEGLWAINSLPMPPAGSVLCHFSDLKRRPENLDALIETLFLGDTSARIQAAIEIIDWLLGTGSGTG